MSDYFSKKISYEDIIFEGRNTGFGAYDLRTKYEKRVTAAMAVTAFAMLLFLLGPVLYNKFKPEEVVEELEPIREVTLAPPPPIDPKTPPPPPMPAAPPPPKVSTIRFIPPEVVPDEEVPKDEKPPVVEELTKAVAGTETVQGDPNADVNELVVDGSGTGTGTVVAPPVEEETFSVVEVMPSFPGGQDEMLKFLSKNIKYPAKAQAAEVQGRVFLEFVVGSDGKLKDFKVVRGIAFGCDEEALRVAKMMPDWIPGKQGGRAVQVKLVVPVFFRLAN